MAEKPVKEVVEELLKRVTTLENSSGKMPFGYIYKNTTITNIGKTVEGVVSFTNVNIPFDSFIGAISSIFYFESEFYQGSVIQGISCETGTPVLAMSDDLQTIIDIGIPYTITTSSNYKLTNVTLFNNIFYVED